SGSFTGNYTVVGINQIGFNLNASDLPGGITLQFGDGDNTYARFFEISETGTWYSLSASLISAEEGKWVALLGSLTNFNAVLENVKFVAIRIARSGVSPQQYVI